MTRARVLTWLPLAVLAVGLLAQPAWAQCDFACPGGQVCAYDGQNPVCADSTTAGFEGGRCIYTDNASTVGCQGAGLTCQNGVCAADPSGGGSATGGGDGGSGTGGAPSGGDTGAGGGEGSTGGDGGGGSGGEPLGPCADLGCNPDTQVCAWDGTNAVCASVATAGAVGGPCLFQAGGGGYTCASKDAVCTNGACVAAAAGGDTGGAGGDTGGDTGAAGGSTGPASSTCQTNAQCGDLYCDPLTKTCKDFPIPPADCGGACAQGQTCMEGTCIGTPIVECKVACNATLGEICDTRVGLCINAGNATCINCEGGVCVAPAFVGLLPTCLLPVPGAPASCANDAACSGTATPSICRESICVECSGVCLQLRTDASAGNGSALLDLLLQSGVDPNSLGSVLTGAALTAQISSAGELATLPGTLLRIDDNIAGLSTLNMATTGSAALLTGERTISTLQASSPGGSLLLNGALKADNLVITPGSSLTISMPAASGGTAPQLNLTSLSLSGPLNLAGAPGATINFPASGVNLQSGGALSISGNGAGVAGNLGSAPLTLASTNGAAASIVSPAGTNFASSGSILGAGASFVVGGLARLSGLVLEPDFSLGSGGQLTVDTSASSSSAAQTMGNVDLGAAASTQAYDYPMHSYSYYAGRSLLQASTPSATLEISGTTATGANLHLSSLRSCPSGSRIRYSVQGSAQAAIDAGFTVFNYGTSTYANVDRFTCAIEVCGSDGNCVAVDNPKVRTSRRLLQAAASAGGSASWEPTKLSISSKSGGDGGSAATIASQPMLLLALALAGLFAIMRL